MLHRWNSGASSNYLDAVHGDILGLQFFVESHQQLFHLLQNRVDQFFVLPSCDVILEVDILHQILDVNRGLRVGAQDPSLLFDGFQNSDDGLLVFQNRFAVGGALEFLLAVLQHEPVKIAAAQISLTHVRQDFPLCLGETSAERAQLRMADIDEHHVSWLVI